MSNYAERQVRLAGKVISIKNALICFLIGFLAFALRFFPTFLAWLKRGEKVFIGTNSLLTQEDVWVYLGDIMVGKKGHLLLRPLFGSGLSKPLWVKLQYVYLGHLARFLKLSPEPVMILASFFLTILLALFLYIFSRLFFSKNGWRFLAVAMVLLIAPFEGFFQAEASTYLSLLMPHFVLVHLCLILLIYLFLLKTWPKPRAFFYFFGFLAGFFLSLVHFFMTGLVIFIFVLGMIFWPIFRKKENIYLSGLLFLVFLPFFILIMPTLINNSFFGGWDEGYRVTFSELLYNLIPFIPLLGLSFKPAKKDPKIAFLVLTFLTQAGLCLLLPVPAAQIRSRQRFFEGAWIWVNLLSLIGFYSLWQQLRKGIQPVYLKIVFLICSPLFLSGNLGVLSAELGWIRPENVRLYATRAEALAWQFLEARCDFSQVVYASLPRGIYLPSKTGCRSFIGQRSETPNYKTEFFKQKSILAGEVGPDQLADYFKEKKIDYIFFSSRENESAGMEPVGGFREIYGNEEFVIYEVNSPPGRLYLSPQG
ncbi:MAG: hypothetical protein JW991_02015 [Candidatus Pacebacteria bacterium]|nr:hypothetical protein [Candidatus Paceibacterota bacterium]